MHPVLASCVVYIGVAAASLAEPASAQKPADSGSEGQPSVGETFALGAVVAEDWLGERLDRAYYAVQAVRSSIWWNLGEVWGWEHAARWLRNACQFARYRDQEVPAIREVADRFLRMDGEGALDLDYGRLPAGAYEDGEVIKGLLAAYELSGDARLLRAAERRGRYVDQHVTGHYYSSIAISPLLALSAAAEDVAFRDLAIRIARAEPLPFLKENAHGAAAAMTLDGYLHLFGATHDPTYLEWARQGWQAIRERMFVTGGLGESLDFTAVPSESDVMCETCQAAWWLILNLHLGCVTGDAEYWDMAERILLNHLAFSQAHRGEGGGFLAGGDVDQGVRGVHNYFCCDNEGALALLETVQHIYTWSSRHREVSVNLFVSSEARLPLREREVLVRQTTDYPERGVVRLRVSTAEPREFAIRFRVPLWTRLASVSIDGVAAPHEVKGGYGSVRRTWRNGEELRIVFPLPMRVEPDLAGRGLRSGDVLLDDVSGQAKRIAVFCGPVVAAMFRTGHGNDLNWIWTGDYTDVLDSGGDARLGYPGSKPDVLERDGVAVASGSVPELTTVVSRGCVPELRWRVPLGDGVTVERRARVLPGLPVTIEYWDDVTGWDGGGRLLCSGLRFATVKDASSGPYEMRSVPYPYPCVTTKPDLDNHVVFAGVYGLYERLADNADLPVTGCLCLNNGYFSAICFYDPGAVDSVACRQTDGYTAVYLCPKAGSGLALSRRLVFPLARRPLNQTTVRDLAVGVAEVRAQIDASGRRLALSGPVLEGAPVAVPKCVGVEARWTIHNDRVASQILDYDDDTVVVFADVPGEYQIERR